MPKTQLVDDSERMIPSAHGRTIMYAEHMTRYTAALKLAKGKVVLDIASGSGYGSKMLSEVAEKVYGVDVSEDAIEYSREAYGADNLEYIVGSAEEIPLPDNSVDLVVTFETLEHIKDYRKFLDEIKRVLKDDGLAIISTPNDEEFAEGNHFHLHEFKLKELNTLLGKRFTHLKPYHQVTWAYVQISDPEFIGKENGRTTVEVYNYAPVEPRQYLYFYILCSNREISETVDSIGGLGGHYSARELGDIFTHYQKLIEDHKTVLSNEQEAHRQTRVKLMMREGERHAINRSVSYQLAKAITFPKRAVVRAGNRAKLLKPKRLVAAARNRLTVKQLYASADFLDAFSKKKKSKLAVVLHLYYVDMLPYFVKKLDRLKSVDYDLFISVTPENSAMVDKIQAALPRANIAVVPNCGRDVLPFVQTMKQLSQNGYEYVLKIHSKKSPHRQDGDEWRDRLVDSLIPASSEALQNILKTLGAKNAAMIGPKGEYVSLLVNFSASLHHVRRIIRSLCSVKKMKHVQGHPDEFGFFGGTMFWARVDSIMDVIECVELGDFEPELGQEDSTLAHAMERLLCVVPELRGKSIYQTDGNTVEPVGYASGDIPEWSEYSFR